MTLLELFSAAAGTGIVAADLGLFTADGFNLGVIATDPRRRLLAATWSERTFFFGHGGGRPAAGRKGRRRRTRAATERERRPLTLDRTRRLGTFADNRAQPP